MELQHRLALFDEAPYKCSLVNRIFLNERPSLMTFHKRIRYCNEVTLCLSCI